jgi:ferredoxin-NADP reductase
VLSLILPARTITQATPRARIIHADLGIHAFPFRAGQAVLAGLADGTVRRPYSLACSPNQALRTNALELLVQIDDHAAPDPHLEQAMPGTLLQIEGPLGSFDLPAPLPERRLLLVAGGTGIAPMRSIMWDTLERDPGVEIGLIYSARSPEELAYFDELDGLRLQRRLDLVVTVTRSVGTSWRGSTGRLNRILLDKALKTTDTMCLVCGPTGFVSTAAGLLRAAGMREDRVVTEAYIA